MVVLIYVYLITMDMEHLFLCVFANSLSSLGKVSIHFSAHFSGDLS